MMMLIPSIVSILFLNYLEKYNIRYNKISPMELKKNRIREIVFGGLSIALCVMVLSIFAVIFPIPFVSDWPYQLSFSLDHVKAILFDEGLSLVYKNSLFVAFLTACVGTFVSYGAAIVTVRSTVSAKIKRVIFNSDSL